MSKNSLEKEFKDLEDNVRVLMSQAADFVKKAALLVDKESSKHEGAFGEPLCLGDMMLEDATYPLIGAMEKAGWRTSSLSC